MKCPKCGDTENIKFFVRHQKQSEDDESTIANCLTVLHASPQCGYNQSMLLEDVIESVFTEWSDLTDIANKLEEVSSNIGGINAMFAGMAQAMSNMPIEAEGEVIDDIPELPQEVEDND